MSSPPRPAGSRLRPLRWLDTAAFWAFRYWLRLLFCLCFRIRVENPPRLRGAYVLAPNHSSFLDPLLLGACTRRRIVYLMTEVIWRSPWLGWFYRWTRTIPVAARGANREALRAARTALQQGRVVGIFPEGGLSRDGELLLGSPGAVSLVLNEAVPIIPVGIVGAHRALAPGGRLRLAKVVVRFGQPIMPSELAALGEGRKQRLAGATRLIMDRIAALTGATSREAELERLRPH